MSKEMSNHIESRDASAQDKENMVTDNVAQVREPSSEKDSASQENDFASLHPQQEERSDAHADTDSDTIESPASDVTDLRERIEVLEKDLAHKDEKLAEWKDSYLRTKADADNYKKRLEKEKISAIEFANSRILLDMLGVLDNFDRALASIEKTTENAALFDGVQMIKKEWIGVLENNWGVQEIDAANQPFNPQLHEAVAIEEVDTQESDSAQTYVSEEFQKGYLLHSRVLRPAKVKVVKAARSE